MRPIFLIGFMASGKTTLGRALGARPGYIFRDLDAEVEKTAGMSVADLFACQGENSFRRLESEVLRRIIKEAEKNGDGTTEVIACGGGTPCHSGNMELMNEAGKCVLLEVSDAVTLRRLREAPAGQRPLVDAAVSDTDLLDFISARRAERQDFYSKASYRFCSDHLENEDEIAGSVEKFIREFCK